MMTRITSEWLTRAAERGSKIESEEAVVPMAGRPTGVSLPTTSPMDSIVAEQCAFDAMRAQLMAEGHANKTVLFKDGVVVALFDTGREAYAAGLERYGTSVPFVIAPIEPVRPAVTSWSIGVMVT